MTRFSARFTRLLPLIAVAALILTTLIAACEGGTVTVELPTVEVESSDGGGGLTITTGGQSTTIAPSAGVTITLGEGTVARYLVQEQFANVDLPNDAIGETSDVTGTFAFSRDGEIVASGSRIVMNAANLRSDEPRRDNYLGDNAIETNTYPEIIFVATDISRLEWPLPTSGETTFIIEGDLTVRDVTRPVVWEATATFNGNSVTGKAETNFTFGEFEMEVPELFFLISIDDNIRLELDFVAEW